MSRNPNPDAEESTPEDDIDALLSDIENDMNNRKENSACEALQKIQGNPEQWTLLKKIPGLRQKYDSLRTKCK